MDNRGALHGQPSQPGPGILLLDSNRWPLTARLAVEFCSLGGRLAAVCPTPGHPIGSLREVKHVYRYAGRRPLESLRVAIDEFKPEIIIPSCDRSVQHLHELHASCDPNGESDRRVRALIERSLGPADSFATISSRYDLLTLAADEGIRVPETIRLDTVEDLRQWKRRPPWLLKAAGTWGGRGVRKADNLLSGDKALLQLTSRASVLELVKQLLLNRDRDWTVSNWQRKRPEVIAQAYVEGRPANCAVVCWQGELLAGFAVEVIQAVGPWQPATVVHIVEGREMIDAAKRIARRLGLSGFFGLDFMIEHGTGAAYLIEMNPRCTPPCYLSLGEGKDLVAAIWAKLADQVVPHRQPVTQKSRIAYFPQALSGMGVSLEIPPLDSAHLDVPNGEPELIRELLHPWSERSLAGKLLDKLRRRFGAKRQASEWAFEGAQLEDSQI